jgi:hypothetical protein
MPQQSYAWPEAPGNPLLAPLNALLQAAQLQPIDADRGVVIVSRTDYCDNYAGSQHQQQARALLQPTAKAAAAATTTPKTPWMGQMAVMAINELRSARRSDLVDSGAATHVCPKDYAEHYPIQQGEGPLPQLRTVTGENIKVYGTRAVDYELDCGVRVTVNYIVTDVRLPALSVSTLLNKGYMVQLGPTDTYLQYGTLRAPITRVGSLFYLKTKPSTTARNKALPSNHSRCDYHQQLLTTMNYLRQYTANLDHEALPAVTLTTGTYEDNIWYEFIDDYERQCFPRGKLLTRTTTTA